MRNIGLIEKIQNLPPETISEVEDFVDFLTNKHTHQADANSEDSNPGNVNLRDRGITEKEASEQRSALASFAEDWELPEMNVYDKL